MALIYNASFDSATRVLSLLDKAGNVISSCEVPSKSKVDDITKPLTFRATQDGSTVSLKNNGSFSERFKTSRDGGKTWTYYAFDTVITLNTGDEVSFRVINDAVSTSSFTFIMTGKIEAWHNVMSMLRTNDFATYNIADEGAFSGLFSGCTSLTKAPVLPATILGADSYKHMFSGCTSLTEAPALPATELALYCYDHMFSGCTSLTKAPVLPVTDLTFNHNCYSYMFSGCTSLTEAPALPATELGSGSYQCMFYGCTSLVEAPVLPATKAEQYCYSYMFSGCTSLTEAPALPATSFQRYCYEGMFSGCTSLTQAPELPVTTLADYCYSYMFRGCTSLTSAPQLPATTLAQSCYSYMFRDCTALKEVRISATKAALDALVLWLSGVSATGDFYCNPDATIFQTDNVSGIPKGWTRRDINLINALTLTATADNSSVKLTKSGTLDNTFEVDTGNGWEGYAFGTVIPLNAGQSCKWRCSAHPTTQSSSNFVQFVMTGTIEASGNVNSMLNSDFDNITSLSGYDYAFMFDGCTSLVKAPELPATTLANHCYFKMFDGCTSLVKAPELPATTLANHCYAFMFDGCTSLVKAPELPATNLETYCYRYMFSSCTSLVQAPSLPATTLADYCYEYMFDGCTSLVKAPELPATNLANNCYAFMFRGCQSLTQAPSLPATALEDFCYHYMFTSCSKLNEVRISATTTATGALSDWLAGVSATGDFYCDPNATIFPTDNTSGIPTGWTRHNIADYPATP